MFPEGVGIDALTGAVTPSTGEYTKRLSEFRSVYRDDKALDDLMAAEGDLMTYKVGNTVPRALIFSLAPPP